MPSVLCRTPARQALRASTGQRRDLPAAVTVRAFRDGLRYATAADGLDLPRPGTAAVLAADDTAGPLAAGALDAEVRLAVAGEPPDHRKPAALTTQPPRARIA
jgi:hypothetical protein